MKHIQLLLVAVYFRPNKKERLRVEAMTASSIILRHEKPLRKLALYLTRDEEDAKDLFQETCLRIVRHIHTFQPGTNESAWVKRIMRNYHTDNFWKNERIPEHVSYEFYDMVTPTPDTLSAEMTEALNSLSPERRMLFTLAHVENYTYDELAALIGNPVGTIRSKLHAAKYLMRESLMAQGARR